MALSKVVAPIVVLIIGPGIVSLISKIETDNWTALFFKIPIPIKILFIAVTIGWITLIFIKKRMAKLKRKNTSSVSFFFVPAHGYVSVAKADLFGLTWIVKAPAASRYSEEETSLDNVNPELIKINIPPRCPNCEVELSEKLTLWGKYLIECVGCSFKKRNSECFRDTADKVTKMVRREIEKKYEVKY